MLRYMQKIIHLYMSTADKFLSEKRDFYWHKAKKIFRKDK
jgi:hypothetical protein